LPPCLPSPARPRPRAGTPQSQHRCAVGNDCDHVVLSRVFVKSVGPSDDLLHGISHARRVERRNIAHASDVELGKNLKVPMTVIGSTARGQSGVAIYGDVRRKANLRLRTNNWAVTLRAGGSAYAVQTAPL
jgi:hypothetical protein